MVEAEIAALEVVISVVDEVVAVVDDPWNAMSAVNAVISPEIVIIGEEVAGMAATEIAAGAGAVTEAADEAEIAVMIVIGENVVISKKSYFVIFFKFHLNLISFPIDLGVDQGATAVKDHDHQIMIR